MARSRVIKPEFASDEKIAKLSRDCRLTYILMWTCCDDYGVTKAHPAWLKSQIYPYDDIPLKRFHEWLNELEKLKRIISFTASNEQYYFIPGFAKHQKVDHPSKQRNPEPPPEILANDSRDFLDETETETETETDNKQKQKPDKLRFLEFVFLTDEEYKKLVDRFGKQLADEKIQALNDGIGSKGYKYQSHYHTILSWDRKNQKDKPQRTDTDFDYINKAFEGKA